jgi:hypothetical protein
MLQRLGRLVVEFWVVAAFGVAAALTVPLAHAGMIETETAYAQDERARVKALLERPELAQGIEKMGIAREDAMARVDAMSDEEVLQLAGKLDAALAGGQISNETLLIVIVLVLLLIILL